MVLRNILPEPSDLLRIEPEELAGILLEFIPSLEQRDSFVIENIIQHLYPPHGGGYAPQSRENVMIAVAEALGWMQSQGLLIRNPNQNAHWLMLTRRARELKTRADVAAYAKGNTLPVGLLQPRLARKVHHLFVRGDHDTAVFQAFKEIEVAVRAVCRFGNELVGKGLMTRAFNTDNGPLSDPSLVASEREAEMALFVGAIGHCKNPTSHRDVRLKPQEAARLIVFASHLLAIVEERAERLDA